MVPESGFKQDQLIMNTPQLEFDFVNVFQKRKNTLFSFFDPETALSIQEAIDNHMADMINGCDTNTRIKCSIPMSIVLGKKNQPEFPFIKEIDRVGWAALGFKIVYAYEKSC